MNMSRARFDREQVIRDSTELFWRKGFSGTSMQDVVKATGLKPGSLYLAFGSKEGLYRAAVEYYSEQSRARVSRLLEEAPSVGEGICQLLLTMTQESGTSNYCSCFLVKSQLELAAVGGELLTAVTDHMARMEALYTEFLSRDYPPEQAQTYAASLIMQIYGLRVYGYLGRSHETMRAALQSGLPWLPWARVDAALFGG